MLRVLVLTTVLLLNVVCCLATPKIESSSGRFWKAFRAAVIANDSSKLIEMTRFPFEVEGVTGDSPVYYNSKQFPELFRRILSQPEFVLSNGKFVPKTIYSLICDNDKLKPSDLKDPDFFRFYQLEFERVDGKWLLTRGYLEE